MYLPSRRALLAPLLALALITGCGGSNTNPGDDDIPGDDDGQPTPTPATAPEYTIEAKAPMSVSFRLGTSSIPTCQSVTTCTIAVDAAGKYVIDADFPDLEIVSSTLEVSGPGSYEVVLSRYAPAPNGDYKVDDDPTEIKSLWTHESDGQVIMEGLTIPVVVLEDGTFSGKGENGATITGEISNGVGEVEYTTSNGSTSASHILTPAGT
ncbi:hypothetical protein HY734_01730 [Candidatus Uhrbacteria bacterium]|nr:hypothetical protein [Candidatus Uhrbacteria bacterium]